MSYNPNDLELMSQVLMTRQNVLDLASGLESAASRTWFGYIFNKVLPIHIPFVPIGFGFTLKTNIQSKIRVK